MDDLSRRLHAFQPPSLSLADSHLFSLAVGAGGHPIGDLVGRYGERPVLFCSRSALSILGDVIVVFVASSYLQLCSAS